MSGLSKKVSFTSDNCGLWLFVLALCVFSIEHYHMAKNITSNKSAFWLGYRDTLPFWLVVGPFGLLFGAVATEAGLNLFEAMVMTTLVVAGGVAIYGTDPNG